MMKSIQKMEMIIIILHVVWFEGMRDEWIHSNCCKLFFVRDCSFGGGVSEEQLMRTRTRFQQHNNATSSQELPLDE